jgi:hypothetical protein
MAQTRAVQVKKFTVLERYEIHFGREGQGFFYEVEDMENHVVLDSKDGLTEGEFLAAIGCALEDAQLEGFQELVRSLA